MDIINQVGKQIVKTFKSTENQLTRFKQNIPYIERVSDYFSDRFPFEMEFRTYNKDNNVKADIFFGEGVLALPIECPSCNTICPSMPSGSTVVYADSFNRPRGQPACGTYFSYFISENQALVFNMIFDTSSDQPNITTDSNGVGYTTNFNFALNGAAGPPWSILLSLVGGIPSIEVHGTGPYLPSTIGQFSTPFYADAGSVAAIYGTSNYFSLFGGTVPGPAISLRYSMESHLDDAATEDAFGHPNTSTPTYTNILEPLLNFDPTPWTNSGRAFFLRYDCDGMGYGLKLWFQDEVEPSGYTVYWVSTPFYDQETFGGSPFQANGFGATSLGLPTPSYTPWKATFPNIVTLTIGASTIGNVGSPSIYGIAVSGNVTTGSDNSPASGWELDSDGWQADWCNQATGKTPGTVFGFCASDTLAFSKTDSGGGALYATAPNFAVGWEYGLFYPFPNEPGETKNASQTVYSFEMKPMVSTVLADPTILTQLGPEPETLTIRGQVTCSPDMSLQDGTPVPITLEHMAMTYGDLTDPNGPTPYAYKYSMLGEVIGNSLVQYDKWTDFTIQITREHWSMNNGKFLWGVRITNPDGIPDLVGTKSGGILLPNWHGVNVIFRNISASPTFDFTGCSLIPNGTFCIPGNCIDTQTVFDSFNGRTVNLGWGTASSNLGTWRVVADIGGDNDVAVNSNLAALRIFSSSNSLVFPHLVSDIAVETGGTGSDLWNNVPSWTVETRLLLYGDDNQLDTGMYFINSGTASVGWTIEPHLFNSIKMTDGSLTQPPFTIDTSGNVWYLLKWEITPGVSEKIKIWPETSPEPSTWLHDAGPPTLLPTDSIRFGVSLSAESGDTSGLFYETILDYININTCPSTIPSFPVAPFIGG